SPVLTRAGLFIGSPSYAAPEQARGLAIDGRADLYAVGCLLFEMLSGTRPYRAETALDVINLHLHGAIPTPTSPHGEIPLALREVVFRALSKDPRDRYQSAIDFRAELEELHFDVDSTTIA